MSPEARLISIGQESGADSNLTAIWSGSSTTPSSSADPFTNHSGKKPPAKRSDASALCFGKTYRIYDCSLIKTHRNKRNDSLKLGISPCEDSIERKSVGMVHLVNLPQQGKKPGIINDTIGIHSTREASNAGTTNQTRKPDREKKTSGNFLYQVAPTIRSSTLRDYQARYIVIFKETRAATTTRPTSITAHTVTSKVCGGMYPSSNIYYRKNPAYVDVQDGRKTWY